MNHHVSEHLLLDYAAGRLPVPHAIVVRTHLALCNACRARAWQAQELGGAVLAALPAAPMAPDALARAFAALGEQEPPALAPPPAATLAEFATGRWWWLGPGIRLMPLRKRDADNTRLDLIRVAPGVRLPSHGHTGQELTCVLQGAFGDETGEYIAGDLAEGDPALDHQPMALPVGEECICLIATTGRLRAHSWLARLVQPLVDV